MRRIDWLLNKDKKDDSNDFFIGQSWFYYIAKQKYGPELVIEKINNDECVLCEVKNPSKKHTIKKTELRQNYVFAQIKEKRPMQKGRFNPKSNS
jgi:type IV secretory pathway VirB9-like protein